MSSSYAFELDHTSTYLRNRDMHIYYQKLNKINNRKKSFLPLINVKQNSYRKENKLHQQHQPLKFETHSIYQKYVIKRDNAIIFHKLDKIHNRSCQAIDNESIVKKYLKIQKNTREGIKKINDNILKECNRKIKNKINNAKPVLNSLKMKTDFIATRNYFKNLRKIRSSQSLAKIFLTKDESDKIDKCFDIHNIKNINKINKNNNNSNKNSYRFNRNIKLLKKLGYGFNNILNNSNSKIYLSHDS